MSFLAAGLVYALLSLDQIAVGPFLLARPLVSGTLVGAALGNGPLGFSAGLVSELFFIAVPPMGRTSSDISIVGALAALWSVEASSSRGAALMLSLLLAAPCGWLVTRGDQWVRRQNDRFGEWIMEHLTLGRERILWKALVLWATLWFLKAWAVFIALAALGQLLVDGALRVLPMRFLDGCDAGARLLPVAGFAAAAAFFWDRLKPAREDRP